MGWLQRMQWRDGEGDWTVFDDYGDQIGITLIMSRSSLFMKCLYSASLCTNKWQTWGVVRGHMIGWHEFHRGTEDHDVKVHLEKRWLEKLRGYQVLLALTPPSAPCPVTCQCCENKQLLFEIPIKNIHVLWREQIPVIIRKCREYFVRWWIMLGNLLSV